MCGIAGIATNDGLRSSDVALVDRMLHSLAHRGPDEQYAAGDERAQLGARRLSIIDLAGGRQPMTDVSGQITVAQNGEIYNYVELREALQRDGYELRTHCDTETILYLYDRYGSAFVQHLRGMFAISIWDARSRRLILARDRLGKKPLYWRLVNGRLSYGSELKALLQDPEVARSVDQSALELYLQFQYIPAPWTIFEGIQKLPPASILVWDGGTPVVERYWQPSYLPKSTRTMEEDVEEGLSQVREAVRIRLRSDVPVGAFLSGGMDSSVVTALMAGLSTEPVRTFSIGFENQEYNELAYARRVSQLFSTSHTEDVVRLDAIELLPALAEHYDEPFADSSALPTFRVAQLAAEQLKVVLTGDGGDESFGGYTRYRAQRVLNALDVMPARVVRTGLGCGRAALRPLGERSRIRRRLGRMQRLVGLTADERFVSLMSIFGAQDRRGLLGDDATDASDGYLLDVLAAGPDAAIDRMLRADLLTYLPEDLLVKVDRATMAHSLEARSPLLDQCVVDFAAALPTDRKIKADTTKVLLRAIAKKLMPANLVDRPKMGFAVPVSDWFRQDLGVRFEELVLAPDSAARDYLDVTVAGSMLEEHRAGQGLHDAGLWSLLMFEVWARRWLPRQTETLSQGSVAVSTSTAPQ